MMDRLKKGKTDRALWLEHHQLKNTMMNSHDMSEHRILCCDEAAASQGILFYLFAGNASAVSIPATHETCIPLTIINL